MRGASVEWYVEVATGADGEREPVLGSQREPQRDRDRRAIVDEPPIAAGRSHIDAHVDYVDFDGKFGKGFDQYYQAELDFTYRFLKPVHAVRLGFGTLSGTGGPKDVIDDDPTNQCLDEQRHYQCRRSTFSYVYTEFEFRLRTERRADDPPAGGPAHHRHDARHRRSAAARGADIDGCEFLTGLRRARRGCGSARRPARTSCSAPASPSGVGTLLEAAYHWLPTQVVPVQLTVQVTDQPVARGLRRAPDRRRRLRASCRGSTRPRACRIRRATSTTPASPAASP